MKLCLRSAWGALVLLGVHFIGHGMEYSYGDNIALPIWVQCVKWYIIYFFIWLTIEGLFNLGKKLYDEHKKKHN